VRLDSRFLGLVLALLLASLILNAAIFQLDQDQRARALATADRELMTRAEFLANTLDQTLQRRMVATFTFAALPSLRAYAASDANGRLPRGPVAREELRALVAADEHLRAASIVDVTGRVIMTNDDTMAVDWRLRAFVREPLRGQLYASVPARDGGEISQYYAAPILNNAGDVAGSLVLRVSAEELRATMSGWEAWLVDEEGVRIVDRTAQPQTFTALAPLTAEAMTRVLAEQRYGAEITQIRATNLSALRDEINRGRASPIVYTDANGKAMHAGARRLRTNLWSVVVLQSEEAMTAPARDSLLAMILVAGLTLLAGLPIGFLLGRMWR